MGIVEPPLSANSGLTSRALRLAVASLACFLVGLPAALLLTTSTPLWTWHAAEVGVSGLAVALSVAAVSQARNWRTIVVTGLALLVTIDVALFVWMVVFTPL